MQRHGEPIGPDVFAKGKKDAMFSQIINRRPDALIDLDLLDTRVALDVKNMLALPQIVIEYLSPADIEDRVRLAIFVGFSSGAFQPRTVREIARAETQRRSKPNSRQLPEYLRGGAKSLLVSKVCGL
jgi:hypothetical protein